MNIHFGIKALSLTAALALTGCMTNEEPARNPNVENLNFANDLSASLAKVSAGEEGALPANACSKLTKAMEDLTEAIANASGEVPASFKGLLDCFKLPAEPTEEDYQKLSDDINANPVEFLECVCGGSDFSGFDALKWEIFATSASTAAGRLYLASESSASGEVANASSSSAAGSTHNTSESSASGRP